MILKQTKQYEDGNITSSAKFRLGRGSEVHVIRTMINQYRNREMAIIRELVSNARDASYENKEKRYVLEITDQQVRVKDFGKGMSPKFIQDKYTDVGHSEKRNKPDSIGYYGIGRLSPLSYTSSYTLITCWKGIKYTYLVSFNNEISLLNISEEPTTDTGTEVIINKKYRHDFFYLDTMNVVYFFKDLIYIEKGKQIELWSGEIKQIGDYKFAVVSEKSSMRNYLCFGEVSYESHVSKFAENLALILDLNGGFEPVPSRESLTQTEFLSNYLDGARKALMAHICKGLEENRFGIYEQGNTSCYKINWDGVIFIDPVYDRKYTNNDAIKNTFIFGRSAFDYLSVENFFNRKSLKDCILNDTAEKITGKVNSRFVATPKSIESFRKKNPHIPKDQLNQVFQEGVTFLTYGLEKVSSLKKRVFKIQGQRYGKSLPLNINPNAREFKYGMIYSGNHSKLFRNNIGYYELSKSVTFPEFISKVWKNKKIINLNIKDLPKMEQSQVLKEHLGFIVRNFEEAYFKTIGANTWPSYIYSFVTKNKDGGSKSNRHDLTDEGVRFFYDLGTELKLTPPISEKTQEEIAEMIEFFAPFDYSIQRGTLSSEIVYNLYRRLKLPKYKEVSEMVS